MKRHSLVLCLSACALASTVHANEWETLLEAATINGEIQSGVDIEGQLYNADITFNITDGDGIANNFSAADRVHIIFKDQNGQVALDTGSQDLDRDALRTWAEQNSDDLLVVIFGDNITTTVSQESNATAMSSSLTSSLRSLSAGSTQATGSADGSMGGGGFTSKIMMNSESATVEDGDTKITSSNGMMAWANTLQNGHDWGLLFQYKLSEKDDQWNTKTSIVGLIPFFKFNTQLAPNTRLHTLLNASATATYIDSALFEDGAGYLEYGAGINFQPVQQLTPAWSVYANAGYQYSEKTIPKSLAPENMDYFVDALNDLDANENLSYGMGSEWVINQYVTVVIDALQVENSLAASGRNKPLYLAANSEFTYDKVLASLGYKVVKNIEDYEETAYMASLSYKW